ncbi:MAG: hypothetical protein MK135_08905 [Polyangiaceae bacterium]|nr:hypothetical protein [Polyangiaceae bacterium]
MEKRSEVIFFVAFYEVKVARGEVKVGDCFFIAELDKEIFRPAVGWIGQYHRVDLNLSWSGEVDSLSGSVFWIGVYPEDGTLLKRCSCSVTLLPSRD